MEALKTFRMKRGTFLFIPFPFFIQLNLENLVSRGRLCGQTRNYFRSLGGSTQHRNANTGAYDSPDNPDDAANKSHPTNIRLEKNDGGHVSLKSARQNHKKYIGNSSVPNE